MNRKGSAVFIVDKDHFGFKSASKQAKTATKHVFIAVRAQVPRGKR